MPVEENNRFGNLRSLRDTLPLEGNIGPVEYDINRKRLKLQTMIQDAIITGRLNPNGDWNIDMNKPLGGGELRFNANGGKGEPNYYLQYRKSF